MNNPNISVIVPCYNEESTISQLLQSILHQTYPVEKMEVVIADGQSTDKTIEKIREFSVNHPQLLVKVIENPKRIIPAALNLAIKNSNGEILLRMDAHALPAADYVERSVAVLLSGQAANVGGVIDVKPGNDTWMAKCIAVATSHPLGVGDAYYRWSKKATEADTVAFGAFWKSTVEKVGGFNESLSANEDYEFNARIRASGGKIWVDPTIRAIYYSRPDLSSLARQYFSYGFWKFRMLKGNPETIRWRQALPPLFVLAILMLLLLSIFWNLARVVLLVVMCIYLAVLFVGAAVAARQKKAFFYIMGIPLAIMTMHFSWGTGFWWSIFQKTGSKN